MISIPLHSISVFISHRFFLPLFLFYKHILKLATASIKHINTMFKWLDRRQEMDKRLFQRIINSFSQYYIARYLKITTTVTCNNNNSRNKKAQTKFCANHTKYVSCGFTFQHTYQWARFAKGSLPFFRSFSPHMLFLYELSFSPCPCVHLRTYSRLLCTKHSIAVIHYMPTFTTAAAHVWVFPHKLWTAVCNENFFSCGLLNDGRTPMYFNAAHFVIQNEPKKQSHVLNICGQANEMNLNWMCTNHKCWKLVPWIVSV